MEIRLTGVVIIVGNYGSGKTEVYLRAMAEARRLGRQAILLVPEITLTPQTVSRLRGRFGGRAAVRVVDKCPFFLTLVYLFINLAR